VGEVVRVKNSTFAYSIPFVETEDLTPTIWASDTSTKDKEERTNTNPLNNTMFILQLEPSCNQFLRKLRSRVYKLMCCGLRGFALFSHILIILNLREEGDATPSHINPTLH
jgi:hypothetical protein